MLVAEVSKSMDELARAINKKNIELDTLKADYSQKLETLNIYLRHLSIGQQSPDELQSLIKQPVECPGCHTLLHDLFKDSDFVLVPRKSVAVPAEEKVPQHPTTKPQVPLLNTPTAPKSKSKKKTCSYCNKLGHSRARCFERLSTEPKPAL